MSPSAPTSSPFFSQICAQIEHDVADLISLAKTRLTRVLIGYSVNTHQGCPIYQDGDEIAGLPVTIDRFYPFTITARSDSERLTSSRW